MPEPDPPSADADNERSLPDPGEDPLGLDPTRYGDWTLKGIAVDF